MATCCFLGMLGPSSRTGLIRFSNNTLVLASTLSGRQFQTSAVDLEARVPNPQKRLERPRLINPKELDRVGNPIYRFRADTAENRTEEELLDPVPKFDVRNRIVFPPIDEIKKYYADREEECPRIQPPFVVHSRQQIQAYPKTLRYAALMVMGLNVDDAIDQLDLHPKKEAQELKETIVEAVDLAIHHHGFEYRSNMYVAYSNLMNGKHFTGAKKLAKGVFKKKRYWYCNYVVMLVEGEAPKDFFPYDHDDGQWKMENRLKELRARSIPWDLQYDRPTWGTKRC